MPMSERAQKAFDELAQLGVDVFDWGPEDGYEKGTAFVFRYRNEDTFEYFFDDTRQHIFEEYRDGRFLNPFGFRQDVHEILAKYNLITENGGMGQIVVYDDPNTVGLKHAAEAKRNRLRSQ